MSHLRLTKGTTKMGGQDSSQISTVWDKHVKMEIMARRQMPLVPATGRK